MCLALHSHLAFEAYPSGTQTISADSWTKLNFATERFDTDGKYDASTSKFTPTVSGKYYIYAIMDVAPSGNGDQIGLRIYKNVTNQGVFKNN